MLSDVQAVLGACRVGKSRQLVQDLNYRRAGELQPLLLHPLDPHRDSASRDQNSKGIPSDPTEPTSLVQTAAMEGPLLFSNTAVGGTFDRLHAGHRILLAATALVTTTMVYVGVTSTLLSGTCLLAITVYLYCFPAVVIDLGGDEVDCHSRQ
ncbi:hypothetical protein ABBQ38_000606 [Trebouxia sp. C0009 RCD-2024]